MPDLLLNEVFGKTRGPGLFRATANAFGRLCETIPNAKTDFLFSHERFGKKYFYPRISCKLRNVFPTIVKL
ncbi:hypothetical protein LEP1GSC068_1219 [Leptospira sp. Fiocruz LV3954]|nr:hypothetical protein LEP1GSC068_1219 [Leptospira sp. Fiocruz LV3954]EMI60511.1 hypothetical protein LEP1GSC076_0655 [Leptospira sp. Fiocruz LV4135]